jgi:hypothetical protein
MIVNVPEVVVIVAVHSLVKIQETVRVLVTVAAKGV